jgi:hypothetical protein
MVQPLGMFIHLFQIISAIYTYSYNPQAPRTLFSRLSSRLLELGFIGSKSDTSMFFSGHDSSVIFILIYVDDILITGHNSTSIATLITKLQSIFSLKDHGQLHYFLGMEVVHDVDGIFWSQKQYILDLLQKSNMINAKPMTSPSDILQVLILV